MTDLYLQRKLQQRQRNHGVEVTDWKRASDVTYVPLPNIRNGGRVITPSPTRNDINSVATPPSESQAQVAAANAPLRVLYGRVRIGAQVADALVYGASLVLILVWGEGLVEQIESVTVGDAEPAAGVTLTHYLGSPSQTPDPTLVSAYAAQGVTYADSLAGIAYSVAVVPPGEGSGFPVFNAIIKGRKLYDPRTGLATFSTNPALALADFIVSTQYGMARSVDSTSLTLAANACDELVGTSKRREINLAIDQTQPCAQWVEALRAYAGCFISQEGGSLRLIPDRPGSSVASFNASSILAGSFKLKKRGVQQVPTVMDIRYTETEKLPWAEESAIVEAAGVSAGTTPRRESRVSLPGVLAYAQAYREAIERLNKLSLSDLSCEFTAFDEALAVQVGDIITVSHPVGLDGKLMRVLGVSAQEAGRWRISALEYDPAAYSDVVASRPTYGDTTLPNPAAPPSITALTVSEEVFQLENGNYSSRIKAVWNSPSYPYLRDYRLEVYQGADLVATGSALSSLYRTSAVQEGVAHVVKVAAVTTLGTVGDWAQASITPQGKYLIPGNVPSVAAFEAGGRVYVSWSPAVDLDIWRYEVRYGAAGVGWASAILIDRVDALRLQSDQLPVGTWTIHVKAVDSVGQYSPVAATVSVSVTLDASAFLVDSYDQTNPVLTNMQEYSLAPDDKNRYFVTEDGVTFATKFSAALGTYGAALVTYHGSVTSTWVGESEDFGLSLSGNWTGTGTVEDLSGEHQSSLGHSLNGSTWTYQPGLTQKLNARFARMEHKTTTSSTMKVTIPSQSIRVDSIPRSEAGTITTSASGPVTVFLENSYTAAKSLQITPQGTLPRTVSFDNLLLCGNWARSGAYAGARTPNTELPAGYEVLQLESEVAAGWVGNAYDYLGFNSAIGYVVQAGDYLEFDVYFAEMPTIGSQFLYIYNGVWGGGTHLFPPNTIAYAIGVWYSYKFAVTPSEVGKPITYAMFAKENDVPGRYKTLLRNIRITDGSGVVRRVIWQSGNPSVTQVFLNGYVNPRHNRANAFDVYSFNGATQSSDTIQWSFQGV